MVAHHTQSLRNELMEQNFLKVVEPYEVLELEFVASKMQLSREEVAERDDRNVQIVRKLSQMILDKKLNASLDQGKGLLVLLPPSEEHVTAVKTVETIDLLGEVVDALRTRAEVYNAKLQEMWIVCWEDNCIHGEANDGSTNKQNQARKRRATRRRERESAGMDVNPASVVLYCLHSKSLQNKSTSLSVARRRLLGVRVMRRWDCATL